MKLYAGDASFVLPLRVEDNSVDLVVTSPPYDNLRSYKSGSDFRFEEVIHWLSEKVKQGGVVVWVVGDAVVHGSETGSSFYQALYFIKSGWLLHDTMIYEKNSSSFPASPNGKRYSQMFEYMFVFSNGAPPKSVNLICDKPNNWAGHTPWGKKTYRHRNGSMIEKDKKQNPVPKFSPRGNIWKYNTGYLQSTKDKVAYNHPATMPEKLAVDLVRSFSNKGDLVLDPFCGAGTTLKAAKMLGRDFIGIDISEEYIDICVERLRNTEVQEDLFDAE